MLRQKQSPKREKQYYDDDDESEQYNNQSRKHSQQQPLNQRNPQSIIEQQLYVPPKEYQDNEQSHHSSRQRSPERPVEYPRLSNTSSRNVERQMDEINSQQRRSQVQGDKLNKSESSDRSYGDRYEKQQREQLANEQALQLKKQRQMQELEEEFQRKEYEISQKRRNQQKQIDIDNLNEEERERIMEEKMEQIYAQKMKMQKQKMMNTPKPQSFKQEDDHYSQSQSQSQSQRTMIDQRLQQQQKSPEFVKPEAFERSIRSQRSRSGSRGRVSQTQRDERAYRPETDRNYEEPRQENSNQVKQQVPADKDYQEFLIWKAQKSEFQQWQEMKNRESKMSMSESVTVQQNNNLPQEPQRRQSSPKQREKSPKKQRSRSPKRNKSPQREITNVRQPIQHENSETIRKHQIQQNYSEEVTTRKMMEQQEENTTQQYRQPSPKRDQNNRNQQMEVSEQISKETYRQNMPTLHPQQWNQWMPQKPLNAQQEIQNRQKRMGNVAGRMSPAGRFHKFADGRQSDGGSSVGMNDTSYMNGTINQTDLDQTISQAAGNSPYKGRATQKERSPKREKSPQRINKLNQSDIQQKREHSPFQRDRSSSRGAPTSKPIELMRKAREAKEKEIRRIELERENQKLELQKEVEMRRFMLEKEKQRREDELENQRQYEIAKLQEEQQRLDREEEAMRQKQYQLAQLQEEKERKQYELKRLAEEQERDRQKELQFQAEMAEQRERQRILEIKRRKQEEEIREMEILDEQERILRESEAQLFEEKRRIKAQQQQQLIDLQLERDRQLELHRQKMAEDQERFRNAQKQMEESTRKKRQDAQNELKKGIKPFTSDIQKERQSRDDTDERLDTQHYVYKKVSPSKSINNSVNLNDTQNNHDFVVVDKDQFVSPTKFQKRVTNDKNVLFDELFAEVMGERNPIEALNNIAMNAHSERRFDFLSDDQFFWTRIAEHVAEEHHRRHSERKNSANRSRRVDSRASNNSVTSGGGVREYLARNNDRSRFFKGKGAQSRSGSRAGSRAGSRGSDSTPNRFLNHRDDDSLVREGTKIENPEVLLLHKEFNKVINKLLKNRIIYLSDILVNMNLVNSRNKKLQALIEQQKDNFVIQNFNDSVQNNLFKVICSILNLRPEQIERSQLDNKLLTTYLQNLSLNKDQNFQTIDKMSTIKRLINRNSYYLDTRQIGQIHKAFQDMFLQRTVGNYGGEQSRSPPRKDQDPDHEERYVQKMTPSLHSVQKPGPSLHSQAMTNRSARPWQGKRPSSRAGNDSRTESAGRLNSRSNSNTSRNDFTTMQKNSQGMIPTVRPSSRNRGMPSPTRGNFGIVQQNSKMISTDQNRSNSSIKQHSASREKPRQKTNQNSFSTKSPIRSQNNDQNNQNSFSARSPNRTDRMPRPSSRTRGMPQLQMNAPAAVQPMRESVDNSEFQEKYLQPRDSKVSDKYLQPPRESAQSQESVMTLNPRQFQQKNQPAAKTPMTEDKRVQDRYFGERDTYKGTNPLFDSDASKQQADPRIYTPSTKKVFPQSLLGGSSPNRQGAGAKRLQADQSLPMNDSFGKYSGPPQFGSQISQVQKETTKPKQRQNMTREPICILKIELDAQNVEEIRVYEGDDPVQIVDKFGDYFNLSDNAKGRLLHQIDTQIKMDTQGL